MREEMNLQRAMHNNGRNILVSSLHYYPDIDQMNRHLYFDNPDKMETKSALEWLKSLYTLASI